MRKLCNELCNNFVKVCNKPGKFVLCNFVIALYKAITNYKPYPSTN